ncbi:MAG: hypothetical protein ACREUX_18335 [Burkholderiales bacterium]
MFDDESQEDAAPVEASDPDPYGGVALGVECAWPAAEGWAA